MAKMDNPETLVTLVRQVSQVLLVPKENQEIRVRRDLREKRENRVRLVNLDLREHKDPRELREKLAMLARRETLDLTDRKESLESQEKRENLETKEVPVLTETSSVLRPKVVTLSHQNTIFGLRLLTPFLRPPNSETRENLAHRDPKVPKAPRVNLVTMENLEKTVNQEPLDKMVPLETKVLLERMELKVPKEPREILELLDLTETKETKVRRVRLDKRDSLESKERRESPVLMEPREKRDPMEIANPTTTLLVTAILMYLSSTLRLSRHLNAPLTSKPYGVDTHLCSSKATDTVFLRILEALAPVWRNSNWFPSCSAQALTYADTASEPTSPSGLLSGPKLTTPSSP